MGHMLQPAYISERLKAWTAACHRVASLATSTAARRMRLNPYLQAKKFMDMWRGLLAHICIPFPWKHCQKLAGTTAFFCRSCRSGCQNWTIVFDTWLMYQGLSTGSAQESVSHSCQGTFKVAAISAVGWESHSSLAPRIAKVGALLISRLGSESTFAVSAK